MSAKTRPTQNIRRTNNVKTLIAQTRQRKQIKSTLQEIQFKRFFIQHPVLEVVFNFTN